MLTTPDEDSNVLRLIVQTLRSTVHHTLLPGGPDGGTGDRVVLVRVAPKRRRLAVASTSGRGSVLVVVVTREQDWSILRRAEGQRAMFLSSRSEQIDLTSATCIAADLLEGQSIVSELPRHALP